MARLRSGEDAAARELFERFAGRLVVPARGRLNRLLARKMDLEDVVQSAFKGVFVHHREGKLEVGDCGGLYLLVGGACSWCGPDASAASEGRERRTSAPLPAGVVSAGSAVLACARRNSPPADTRPSQPTPGWLRVISAYTRYSPRLS